MQLKSQRLRPILQCRVLFTLCQNEEICGTNRGTAEGEEEGGEGRGEGGGVRDGRAGQERRAEQRRRVSWVLLITVLAPSAPATTIASFAEKSFVYAFRLAEIALGKKGGRFWPQPAAEGNESLWLSSAQPFSSNLVSREQQTLRAMVCFWERFTFSFLLVHAVHLRSPKPSLRARAPRTAAGAMFSRLRKQYSTKKIALMKNIRLPGTWRMPHATICAPFNFGR